MIKFNEERAFLYIKFLAFLGIVLAVYLLWQQFTTSEFQPCSINATVNCEAIISGEVSKTLGIPTPLFGLVGYILIFIAAVLKRKIVLAIMASLGLGFCLWIAYRELFELYVICPICILCQLIMISVFSLAVVVTRKK